MPVAPGPNLFQWSFTGAMWSSSKRAPPASAVTRTSIQLTSPSYSQVAAKLFGGSQLSIVPPAWFSNW
jgi:hypothetical protein